MKCLILSILLIFSALANVSCSTRFSERYAAIEAEIQDQSPDGAAALNVEESNADPIVATAIKKTEPAAEKTASSAPQKKSTPKPAVVAEAAKKVPAEPVKKTPVEKPQTAPEKKTKVAKADVPKPEKPVKTEKKADKIVVSDFSPSPYFTLFTKTEDTPESPSETLDAETEEETGE